MQPTASKASHLIACQWAYNPELKLPNGGGKISSDAAAYGSRFHQILASMLDASKPAASAGTYAIDTPYFDAIGHAKKAYDVLTAWLEGSNPWGKKFYIIGVEKSIAYDSFSVDKREIEFDSDSHTYVGLTAREIGGTIDLLCVSEDGEYLVIDHKTGEYEDYSQPHKSAQLLTFAAAYKAKWVAFLHSPRVTQDAMLYCDEVSPEELWDFTLKLRKALERVGDGSMRPGPQCRFCPARAVCPASDGEVIKAAMGSVTEAGGIVKYASKNLATPANVGKLHLMMANYDKLRERARAEIRNYVENNPGEVVVRPDGRVLELKPRTQERLSKASVLRALGLVEGTKLLEELRARGVVVEETTWVLSATEDD